MFQNLLPIQFIQRTNKIPLFPIVLYTLIPSSNMPIYKILHEFKYLLKLCLICLEMDAAQD